MMDTMQGCQKTLNIYLGGIEKIWFKKVLNYIFRIIFSLKN